MTSKYDQNNTPKPLPQKLLKVVLIFMIASFLVFDAMPCGGHIDFPDFRTFPLGNFLGLFICQRGYHEGYKTSERAFVPICVRPCYIMPLLQLHSSGEISCFQEIRLYTGWPYTGTTDTYHTGKSSLYNLLHLR